MRFAILIEEKEAPFPQTKGPKAWVLQPLINGIQPWTQRQLWSNQDYLIYSVVIYEALVSPSTILSTLYILVHLIVCS